MNLNFIYFLVAVLMNTTAAQAMVNGKPGARHVPERDIPVPTVEVSQQAQELIKAPYIPEFNLHPKDAAEWKAFVDKYSEEAIAAFPALIEKFNVTVEQVTIAGVNAFTITPATVPEKNKNRILLHITQSN